MHSLDSSKGNGIEIDRAGQRGRRENVLGPPFFWGSLFWGEKRKSGRTESAVSQYGQCYMYTGKLNCKVLKSNKIALLIVRLIARFSIVSDKIVK